MSSYLSYIIIVVLWSFSVTRWVDYFSIFGYYTNETLHNCNFCQNRFKILRNTKKTFEKLPQTIRNLCQNGEISPNLVKLCSFYIAATRVLFAHCNFKWNSRALCCTHYVMLACTQRDLPQFTCCSKNVHFYASAMVFC